MDRRRLWLRWRSPRSGPFISAAKVVTHRVRAESGKTADVLPPISSGTSSNALSEALSMEVLSERDGAIRILRGLMLERASPLMT
jgi:hypothetical protein